jgi:hypothetical protein
MVYELLRDVKAEVSDSNKKMDRVIERLSTVEVSLGKVGTKLEFVDKETSDVSKRVDYLEEKCVEIEQLHSQAGEISNLKTSCPAEGCPAFHDAMYKHLVASEVATGVAKDRVIQTSRAGHIVVEGLKIAGPAVAVLLAWLFSNFHLDFNVPAQSFSPRPAYSSPITNSPDVGDASLQAD